MKNLTAVLVIFLSYGITYAQEKPAEDIQDNSFFIEEAFNQEPRVVQHIFTGFYNSDPDELSLGFTQEWPFFSQTHQLSFTIPYSSLENVSGINDILINYRYQLVTLDDWAAVSPRLSIILPTGDAEKGLGDDITGLQFNLPVSKQLNDKFIMHSNLGFTFLPGVQGINKKHDLLSYNAGASVIWLAKKSFNLMFEYAINFNAGINESDGVRLITEHIFNPGFRFAINLGELQIVPGLAVPLSISEGESRVGAFLYLSFEHPF